MRRSEDGQVHGGKALDRAIRSVFGAKAAIQRYCRHKERNILEHLPQDERPLVQRRLRTAWATADPDQAAAELEQLARGLARQRPGAAASLREGLAETLTVTRLGVGGQTPTDGGVDQPERVEPRTPPTRQHQRPLDKGASSR